MLPKNRRIPKDQFPILKNGKVFQNDLFILKVSQYKDQSRFCFSVSKKINKNAVIRNKMRRLGYQNLAKHLPIIKPGIIACFYFKMKPKNKEEVDQKLFEILKESNLIK